MELYNGVSYKITPNGSIVYLDKGIDEKNTTVSLNDKNGLEMTLRIVRNNKKTGTTIIENKYIIPVKDYKLNGDTLEIFAKGDKIRKENVTWLVIDYLTTAGR